MLEEHLTLDRFPYREYNIIKIIIIQIILKEVGCMDFIGRTSELATLNTELNRGSGFVVIYGRRRVGKTTLIKEFIKDKRAFYFLATTESEAQSMKRFAGVLSRTTKNPMLSKVTFTDWLDLFQVVADDHPDERKVLVIDEFPYLVKTNPEFPSILQNAWDEVLKDHNVMLILCGSLISMMKKHALAYNSPLLWPQNSTDPADAAAVYRCVCGAGSVIRAGGRAVCHHRRRAQIYGIFPDK